MTVAVPPNRSGWMVTATAQPSSLAMIRYILAVQKPDSAGFNVVRLWAHEGASSDRIAADLIKKFDDYDHAARLCSIRGIIRGLPSEHEVLTEEDTTWIGDFPTEVQNEDALRKLLIENENYQSIFMHCGLEWHLLMGQSQSRSLSDPGTKLFSLEDPDKT